MDYMTVKEASEKWKISERRICVLCKEGRIPNAIKKSKVWMIPSCENKPADKRTNPVSGKDPGILFVNATYCETHSYHELSVEDHAICDMENLLLCGEFKQCAYQIKDFIRNCKKERYLPVAYYLYYRCALFSGTKEDVTFALKKISDLVKSCETHEISRMLLNAELPDSMEPAKLFFMSKDSLDEELYPFLALQVCRQTITQYFRATKYKNIYNLEMICHELDHKNCPEIIMFYHILLSLYYNTYGQIEYSRWHLKRAYNIAKPRSWYTPFAEYSLCLNMHDLAEIDSDFCNKVDEFSQRIIENYVRIDVLSDFISMLPGKPSQYIKILYQIACGKNNKEIASQLGLSEYMVKKKIADIYSVSGFTRRNSLKNHVLSHIVV